MRKIQNKAQMVVSDAPSIVLIVGLLFMVMATIAFIGQKYGDALDTDNTAGAFTGEVVTQALISSASGDPLTALSYENGANCVINNIRNGSASGIVINSANYTEITDCHIKNLTSTFVTSNWYVNYTFTYSAQTIASNVTTDLETEISNNTSIAGIVLTISLVGIVLTILIGVFMGIRGRTRV